jgi:hypothetical protein
MTIEQRNTTVETSQELAPPQPDMPPYAATTGATATRGTFSSRSTTVKASGAEVARRVVVFVFGLIQAVIVLRIVLLLLNARTGNDLVAGVLTISQVFVAPFEGILRSNALKSGGSVLDLAAVTALIGWTIVEFGVFAAINLFRRESAQPGVAG